MVPRCRSQLEAHNTTVVNTRCFANTTIYYASMCTSINYFPTIGGRSGMHRTTMRFVSKQLLPSLPHVTATTARTGVVLSKEYALCLLRTRPRTLHVSRQQMKSKQKPSMLIRFTVSAECVTLLTIHVDIQSSSTKQLCGATAKCFRETLV